VEEATKLFADLQAAYEILSDPNERAFYDSHRNTTVITDEDLYDHVRSGKTKEDVKRRQGEPGVRLEQLMRFFEPKLGKRLDDSNEVSVIITFAET
jgi:DnaJ family protein A protein 5